MSGPSHVPPPRGLAAAAVLRTVTIDELSTVRYIHATAVRLLASSRLSEDEVSAFVAYLYSPAYAETLVRQRLIGATIDNQLVATAGWSVSDDMGSGVRIRSLFVRPPFAGIGIGGRLLAAIEQDARAAGFNTFAVRSTLNATGFFEANNYSVTSHGVRALGGVVTIPVAFMRKATDSDTLPAEPSDEPTVG